MYNPLDPTFIKKEEYDDSDCLFKKVKTEPEIPTKKEEDDSNPTLRYYRGGLIKDSMTLDWKGQIYQQLPYICTRPNHQLMNDNPSTSDSAQPKQPFVIIKTSTKVEPSYSTSDHFDSSDSEDQPRSRRTYKKDGPPKEKKKVVKNYVGLLCAGFSRTMLKAEAGSPILDHMQSLISNFKQKYDSLAQKDDKELLDAMMAHVYKAMCGKKVRKSNTERDFKIRNVKDIQKIIKCTKRDNQATSLNKEVMKEMFEYFFTSEYYKEWLMKGMITEPNKAFFLQNREEIHRKFQNPGTYKPKFQQPGSEEL